MPVCSSPMRQHTRPKGRSRLFRFSNQFPENQGIEQIQRPVSRAGCQWQQFHNHEWPSSPFSDILSGSIAPAFSPVATPGDGEFPRKPKGMATLHLIHGFVGAGKTPLSKRLETKLNAIRFPPDEWMIALYTAMRAPKILNN